MSTVKVGENESIDNALRRFKRKCARDGIIGDLRKREAYEKPSVKRKKKAEAARKRMYKNYFGFHDNPKGLSYFYILILRFVPIHIICDKMNI